MVLICLINSQYPSMYTCYDSMILIVSDYHHADIKPIYLLETDECSVHETAKKNPNCKGDLIIHCGMILINTD